MRTHRSRVRTCGLRAPSGKEYRRCCLADSGTHAGAMGYFFDVLFGTALQSNRRHARMSAPIAYTYEASEHCEDCAEARFGRDEHGDINGIDDEGNPVGAVAPWDEWDRDLVCGTCGTVIRELESQDA